MEITLEDILKVSQIMGKDFSDAERTSVIQCLGSCDINACPGSGKTTTMVAKLLIMSEKLAGSLMGICALSHTNAAKNEIEKSFGTHSGALLRYPNFVGTIQVFVDLFLAIPAYIEEFGRRPIAIDDDIYENIAKRNYHGIQYAIRQGLEYHTKNTGPDFVSSVCYGFTNFELVSFFGNRETNFYCSSETQTYREVLRWKQELTSLGYLTYHDAFSYAKRYLLKYPNLAAIIAKRFPFLFIDEMQDTDAYQNEIIETIFRDRSIIQRFGDPNQTIYNQRSQGGEPVWQPVGEYAIGSSRRLSPSISRLSQGISSHPHEIRGNPLIPDLSHTVILFNQQRRQDVIPRFGQIIEEQHVNEGPYKVVGAVGRISQNPDHLSISSYWPLFQRRLLQKQLSNPFWGHIYQAHTSIKNTNNYLDAQLLLLRAFTELLRFQQIRTQDGQFYNTNELQKSIRESGIENYNQFRGFLLFNCEWLYSHNELEIEATISQAQLVFSYLGHHVDGHVEDLIRSRDENIPPDQPIITDELNTYNYSPQVSIEINTIHAVKGQTHKAILVLETFYYQYDLQSILPYLTGKNTPRPGVRILTRFLPLIYVACTRPSYLLCLAIQKDHVNDVVQNQLSEFGWHIDELL